MKQQASSSQNVNKIDNPLIGMTKIKGEIQHRKQRQRQ